jgi:hypothetical protein
VRLRKQNHSVYEISDALKEQHCPLSPTAVREVLKQEGFAPLPRRLDDERPEALRPTIEAVADVRQMSLAPRTFTTTCGGLFLFVPDLVRLHLDSLVQAAHLPGSKMIPAGHALRACLALKLWSIERHSHVMALAADEGLALFAGLNVSPKKSYLSEYSSRVSHTQTTQLLAAWHDQLNPMGLFDGTSFNLDFHSVPYYGEIQLSSAISYRHAAAASPASSPSWLRTPLAAPSVIPMPISAKARRPRRSSTSSLSGSAPTESCPAIWSSIPASPPTPIWHGWTRWGLPLSLSAEGLPN